MWTPDGRHIAFASTRENQSTPNLWWQRAEDTASAERLNVSANVQLPGSWHPSGKFLAFEEVNQVTKSDLMLLPMEGDEKSGWRLEAAVFSSTQFDERQPAFSPDGKSARLCLERDGAERSVRAGVPGAGQVADSRRWQ